MIASSLSDLAAAGQASLSVSGKGSIDRAEVRAGALEVSVRQPFTDPVYFLSGICESIFRPRATPSMQLQV
jgi:hypothetical protein